MGCVFTRETTKSNYYYTTNTGGAGNDESTVSNPVHAVISEQSMVNCASTPNSRPSDLNSEVDEDRLWCY